MAFKERLKKLKSPFGKQTWFASVTEIIFLILIIFAVRTFLFGLYQVPTGSMETTMLVGERFFADKLRYWFTKPKRNDIIAFNDPTFEYSKNKFVRLWQQYVWGPVNFTKRIIAGPNQTVKGVVEDGKPVIYVDGKKIDEPYLNKYPLISVFKKDKKEYQEACNQILRYVAQGKLDKDDAEILLQRQMECIVGLKSYDPSKPFNNQPFYTIDPSRIYKVDGKIILREPGTPDELPQVKEVRKGNNYWNGSDNFYVELGDNQYWVMGDNRKGSSDARWFGPIDRNIIHGKILFRIWSIDSNADWWIFDLLLHPIEFFKRMRWSRFFQSVN